MGEGEADHVLPSFIENGAPPHLFRRGAPAAFSDVAGVMGWIDGWASRHNPLRPSQGLEGIMICCVGAALRGDGNPPEVPICRNSRP